MIAAPLVRLACERHLNDLAGGAARGLRWDWPAAERVLRFFPTVLRLAGGPHEGKPFELHPAQQFIVGALFGWKLGDVRRFSAAYIEMGKGSGKSPLAAGVGLYMFSADGEPRAEVYSAAVDRDQAKILFRDAVVMVEMAPALSSRIKKSGGTDGDATKVWNLAHLESGSFFRPIASEARGRGKSGFRPYCVLLDEIHEHPTDAMVEFTKKNIKGRPNALALMITNSGVIDSTSVCLTYHEYAAQVLNGQADDQFFAFVCGLDEDDDWKDPKVWAKANPLLGVTIPESYLEQEVREAVGMPSKQSLTRRLNFCEWVEAAEPFIDHEVWVQNGGQVDIEALKGKRCYGGLDLSGKNDLTALSLVFESDEDGKKSVLSFAWTPEDTLRQREERDRAPYRLWVDQGHMIAVPGKTIDYRFVAKQIGELAALYDMQAVAFDRYRIDDLERELDAEGIEVALIAHGQGFKDMTPAIETLEDDLLECQLCHGDHPVLTSCAFNARVATDPAGLRKFDKRKATGRIDLLQSLAMAEAIQAAACGGGLVYDDRGLITA